MVPDSDDDDALDSQSVDSHHSSEYKGEHNEIYELEPLHRAGRGGGEDCRPQIDDLPYQKDFGPICTTSKEISGQATVQTTLPADRTSKLRQGLPSSSPDSPRTFKVPQAPSELDGDASPERCRSAVEQYAQDSFPNIDYPAGDEISRTYVRLTSSLSSILSSPPSLPSLGSQRSVASLTQASGLTGYGEGFTTADERWITQTYGTVDGKVTHGAVQGIAGPERRNLRQRNPIQLHPYVMEQEKYRRTLKARGMTPMILAQTNDERRPKHQSAASPERDSQETSYSLDIELETEESQPMELDSTSLPPSSSPTVHSGPAFDNYGVMQHDPAAIEDDEFPDIEEILRRKGTLSTQMKPPLNFDSSKPKRAALTRPERSPLRAMSRPNTLDHVFDVPASPLPESPSFATEKHTSAPYITRDASLSSRETTPFWDDGDEMQTTDVLTPATSALKPTSEAILLESGSEEDRSVRANSDSVSLCSSSSEAIQIRKVGKKIRGVLPASHLRLVQQQKNLKLRSFVDKDSLSNSPANQLIRRGIALPRTSGTPRSNGQTKSDFPILSDDSGDSDGIIGSTLTRADSGPYLFQSRPAPLDLDSAEEDDRIDALLPSRKRSTGWVNTRSRKKRRGGTTSLFQHRVEPYRRQPKITDHLSKQRRSISHGKLSLQPEQRRLQPKSNRLSVGPSRKTNPPRLSILDVASATSEDRAAQPAFIRIAARTVKSRRDQGRQSPTTKFIRLAHLEDTAEVQSVLREWRNGSIHPKDLEQSSARHRPIPRAPLRQITANRQSRLSSSMSISTPRPYSSRPVSKTVGGPRQLVVSKVKQKSKIGFVADEADIRGSNESNTDMATGTTITQKTKESHHLEAPQARPAQLEASSAGYPNQYPVSSFKTTKKALDVLYRRTRSRAATDSNFQLNRFLANDDVLPPTVFTTSEHFHCRRPAVDNERQCLSKERQRQRKRLPQRLDAGAALYRQPSEPLILESFAPLDQESSNAPGAKLIGLGKLGINHPLHFDIFPLQSGIFFHESTFIGSGRLSRALKYPEASRLEDRRPQISHKIGDRALRWGPWDETVSSEIGTLFDWVFEQLKMSSSAASDPRDSATSYVVESVSFLVDYAQDHVSFRNSQEVLGFTSRSYDVLQEFWTRLDAVSDLVHVHIQHTIEVLSRCMAFLAQVLQLSKSLADASITYKLEDLLTRLGRSCVDLLLSVGMDSVRKLYDDLQYLSYRERGIKCESYVVQAWVITIKVLNFSGIPKGSFWDVANSGLMGPDIASLRDARVMERMWYSMFSLLPLCEFDESGVLSTDLRHSSPFDGWTLPQQMLKSVFGLYESDSRQSPSFNDYVKVLISRCHHLMTKWGWWRCSGIVGTSFDFFASQNLVHLRNEEVHKSPRFLEELDADPSLEIETEDRCFHVFLKITALSIRHMHQTGDTKGIRNLIPRLLPNHDRQYPKEETIHQRALASLRNHHDLLCTLYWAAPPEHRPSINLIQDLVTPERSHREVCLLNLKSWTNLARFVLAASFTSDTFRPFIVWQNTFFAKLLQQYLETDLEIRKQAELLSGIPEASIQHTILVNKRTTMSVLLDTIEAVKQCLNDARHGQALVNAMKSRQFYREN